MKLCNVSGIRIKILVNNLIGHTYLLLSGIQRTENELLTPTFMASSYPALCFLYCHANPEGINSNYLHLIDTNQIILLIKLMHYTGIEKYLKGTLKNNLALNITCNLEINGVLFL